LIADEIADGSLGDDALLGTFSFRRERGSNQSFFDQSINPSWLLERDEPGDRVAVVRDSDLAAFTNYFQVSAQMISQLTHACFHHHSMALSDSHI